MISRDTADGLQRASLIYSSATGDIEHVEVLLKSGRLHHNDLRDALGRALKGQHVEVAISICRAGTSACYSDLVQALDLRDEELVETMLAAEPDLTWNADPSDESVSQFASTAVSRAIEWGHLQILEHLISNGAAVNEDVDENPEGEPLNLAILRKDHALVNHLLKAGAKTCVPTHNSTVKTPLVAAVETGDAEMVRFVLSVGADPDDQWAVSAAVSRNRKLLDLIAEQCLKTYPIGRNGFASHALKEAVKDYDVESVCSLRRGQMHAT